jgi:hypothetical protein
MCIGTYTRIAYMFIQDLSIMSYECQWDAATDK